MDNIFKNCSNLTTIYASENFAFGSGLKNGADMFLGCDKLKGFIEYNKNTDTDKNNSEFANYKTGYFTKLVRSSEVRAELLSNIEFISVTFAVLKLVRTRDSRAEHLLIIEFILVTFAVLK